MTYEKALEHTEQTIALCEGTGIFKENLDYWKKVKEAIEKQIQEKPRKYKASPHLIYFECPACDRNIQADIKYCRYCGQALDWSEGK